MSEPVSVILTRKGNEVHTIGGHLAVAAAARRMHEHGVGALVVSFDGKQVEGIVTERDIVAGIADTGQLCLQRQISAIMTSEVTTCRLDDRADELMTLMTSQRIRHIPVVDDEVLVGIISIGDVVKSHVNRLEVDSEAMDGYLRSAG